MTYIVVVDADCLKYLENADEREVIRHSLNAAGFVIQPTLINLVEVVKNENTTVVKRSYHTIERLAIGTGLLSLPQQILRETGSALLAGAPHYVPERINPAVALDGDGHISVEFQDAARQYADPWNASRTAHFAKYRTEIRRQVKQKGIRISDGADFLDRLWRHSDGLKDYAQIAWQELHIGDYPGLETVWSIRAWRLFLEAEGHAVYERLILEKQAPQTAGFVDLSQLLYLAAGRQGILVTNDKGLLRAGKAILHRRYPGFVAWNWNEFKASAI